MELEQFSLLIDYHPWQGDFRFTGGYTDNKIYFPNREMVILLLTVLLF